MVAGELGVAEECGVGPAQVVDAVVEARGFGVQLREGELGEEGEEGFLWREGG